ncbi:transposable element Tcb1 transposase [Trichonephila clavipes]|nr:transposable element Tcb1 transposase [Trichonephila clavipes]
MSKTSKNHMCCHSRNGSPRSHFSTRHCSVPTVRVSQDYLRTFTALPWPFRSSELSLIKHIWDHLGGRVRYPTSLNELEARLQQMWNEMSQDTIHNLYA